jgi:hypothetical protein
MWETKKQLAHHVEQLLSNIVITMKVGKGAGKELHNDVAFMVNKQIKMYSNYK